MKKNIFATLVAMLLVLVMGTTCFASSRNYSDWFDLDRINAISCETNLTRKASREEVALLVAYLADELDALPSQKFKDFIDDDDFISTSSYKMVQRLSSTGIVTGYPGDVFGPQNDITRAEALAIILRTVDYFGLETNESRYRNGENYFTDTADHWAAEYCERAYREELVNGRGGRRFYPDADITREEIITILVNLMGESNNPLISAIDKVYDLEFDNSTRTDVDRPVSRQSRSSRYYDDDYYYDRYYDDRDYDDRTERPTVDTGSSSSRTSTSSKKSSSSSSKSTQKEPERPVVDLSGYESVSSYEEPERPVVDLTGAPSVSTSNTSSSSSVSLSTVETERPSVSLSTGSYEEPDRPTVDLSR